MYRTEEGVTVGPLLYADDNLTPLALTAAEQLQPILSMMNTQESVALTLTLRKQQLYVSTVQNSCVRGSGVWA